MKTRALLLSLLLLPASALAKELPHEVLQRGFDGPSQARLETVDTAEARMRWGLESAPPDRRSLVVIALGEQPAGTRVAVSGVYSKDRFGFDVGVRLLASVPRPEEPSVRSSSSLTRARTCSCATRCGSCSASATPT